MNTLHSNLLGSLPFGIGVPTRQVSAENPTGGKGAACRWDPDPSDPDLSHSGAALGLGKGWKVRPFIRIHSGATATLAEITGPGCINEMFITSDLAEYRALVLRIYWDGEREPSVETPLGDFFAMGHDGAPHTVSSLPVVVGPFRACSSYWQMPFRGSARITLQNEHVRDAGVVAYRILYKLHDVPGNGGYFHAQWRRAITARERPEHVIVDGIRGRGSYVGTYLAWKSHSPGWWGEGEVKFYIDGDTDFPTMSDNGTEDYFGGAWGFHGKDGNEQAFSTPFLGLPLVHADDPQGPRLFGMYRWHLLDCIGFGQDLRVTVQALGWQPDGRYRPLQDDIASVAYWYQAEPHAGFPALPGVGGRWT